VAQLFGRVIATTDLPKIRFHDHTLELPALDVNWPTPASSLSIGPSTECHRV
jgi:hypothetical protein